MSTFVAEINKLKNVQQNLEKNELILVQQFSKVDEEPQIYEFYRETATSRASQVGKLQNDVKEIVVPLRKVRSMINEDNIVNIDLKEMKKDMKTIQNNIHNLKKNTQASLNALADEEEQFTEEMQVFEQKINDWSKPITTNFQNNTIKKVSTVIPENISQEVKEFMEFIIANGGHENGWTSEDHNLFLKYRIKTKDINKLAEIVHAVLPDISEEEVISHEKWYQKYIELKEKQKAAIKDWRSNKIQTKKNSPPKTISPEQNYVFKSFSECLNKEQMQQKITTWKAEKFKQARDKYDQELEARLKQKELEKQQKEKQKQIKAQVENWRTTKKIAEETEKLEKQMQQFREQKNRAAKANKLIKQFQNQDNLHIQHKLQTRFVTSKSVDIHKTRQIEAPRDPKRLLKPTKQWILRTYGSESSANLQNNSNLRAIPKLYVWLFHNNFLFDTLSTACAAGGHAVAFLTRQSNSLVIPKTVLLTWWLGCTVTVRKAWYGHWRTCSKGTRYLRQDLLGGKNVKTESEGLFCSRGIPEWRRSIN